MTAHRDCKKTIYLAARFGRQDEIRRYAAELRALGHEVTSTWFDASPADDNLAGNPAVMNARIARADIRELYRAETVVSFTEPAPTDLPQAVSMARGGRHCEFGYALAHGREMVIVGPQENIFHWAPEVTQFDTWAAYLETLKEAVPA